MKYSPAECCKAPWVDGYGTIEIYISFHFMYFDHPPLLLLLGRGGLHGLCARLRISVSGFKPQRRKLCCVSGQDIFIAHCLSPPRWIKRIAANLLLEKSFHWLASRPVESRNTSYYWNRDKLRPDEPLDSCSDLPIHCCYHHKQNTAQI